MLTTCRTVVTPIYNSQRLRRMSQLTSQEKKGGVMREFSSAPHLLYGNRRRNQAGTCERMCIVIVSI